MSEMLNVLSNLRSLRVSCREFPLEQLQEALEKFTTVVAERVEQEEQIQAELKEKADKIETYRKLLLDDGISPHELMAHIEDLPKQKAKSPRAPRPAKYRYTDNKGVEKTWTGQGRTPLFLQDKNLDDYLI